MAEPLNILVIEDHNADFLLLERHLRQNGLTACCSRVDTLPGLKDAVWRGNWDLVLSDYNVPQLDFQEGLNLLLEELAGVPVIMVTGSLGEEMAVELLKLGVHDFVLKGNMARLVPAIERSLYDAAVLRAKLATEDELRQAQKMEAVGQLAGGVAHDFNNILTAIIGYAHLILSLTKDNGPVTKYTGEIIKASARAVALTSSLLTFSRKQAVMLVEIDLWNVLQENEIFLRRLIREDIELKIVCTEKPLSVLADRGQIEQVIMNLVANARDAMPNGGIMSIELRPVILDQEIIEVLGSGTAGTYLLLSVSDSGSGMDKATQSRIFEPFFTTKEQGEGTGLGLSLTYGIIKKHDGLIGIESEPGKGTTIKIYLPVVLASVPDGESETAVVAALTGGAETILICEDDPIVLSLSAEVLGLYGYRVIQAVDGQAAVDAFVINEERIQLVVLDAIMPKKNGKAAFQEMRLIRPGLKAVFVSGYEVDIFTEEAGFDVNVTFIQKPFSPTELAAKVRALLDRETFRDSQQPLLGARGDDR